MKIVGLDAGSKTLGVAISDKHRLLARPLATIRFNPGDEARAIDELKRLLAAHETETIVLGLPRNMDGTKGAQALMAEALKDIIEEALGIDVVLWDERLSTKIADATTKLSGMRRKKRKRDIDQEAATHILQGYLDYITTKEAR